MAGKDEVHWNAETQSWETGGAPRGRYTPPPPPRPEFEPVHPPTPAPAPGPGAAPGPAPGDGSGSASGSAGESATDPATGPGPGTDQRSQYPAPAFFPGPDPGAYHPVHPAYSTPGPLPAPGPASRPSVRRVVAVLTAALLVGGAAGFGGWYLWSRDSGGTHKDDARTKVSTAPTGPSAQDPAPVSTPAPTLDATSASPSPSALPAGYHRVSNGEFDTAVPDGWQPETQSGKNGVTIYFFRESGGGPRYLQVFRVSEDDPTPRGTLTAAEKDLRKQLPGYHRNSLTTVPDARGEAAELDYSHPSQKWGVEVRTLDRVVPAGGGELYVVLTSGPADAWPAQRQVQEAAVTSFCLAGAC
ncbi:MULTISPECIES: hypothetical protein [unclassified Streptomyces]|uniref:hypothetical protein n=1 Tax=unclassified Streptomyces TaxID=2593676 RepID=UPI00339DC251|nr:hypothetical protein OG199_17835 [Streptomyces sp. NBC_01176]